MSEFEKIENNWNIYSKLLNRLRDDNIDKMLEIIGERLILAPANPRKHQYGCEPGGLISSSLSLVSTLKSLNEYYNKEYDIKSLYKVALLHDLGRLGTSTKDWLIPQESEWHQEKLGEFYRYNDELPRMTPTQRTLMMLLEFGVALSQDEFLAISSIDSDQPLNKLGALLDHAKNMNSL